MKVFQGVIISKKAKNTSKVRVERVVVHPVYGKRYKKVKNYLVDDKTGSRVGDKVYFVAVKPVSKMKKWSVVDEKVISKKAGGKTKKVK